MEEEMNGNKNVYTIKCDDEAAEAINKLFKIQ